MYRFLQAFSFAKLQSVLYYTPQPYVTRLTFLPPFVDPDDGWAQYTPHWFAYISRSWTRLPGGCSGSCSVGSLSMRLVFHVG